MQADRIGDNNKEVFVKTWGGWQFNQCQVSLMRVTLSQGWIVKQEKSSQSSNCLGIFLKEGDTGRARKPIDKNILQYLRK